MLQYRVDDIGLNSNLDHNCRCIILDEAPYSTKNLNFNKKSLRFCSYNMHGYNPGELMLKSFLDSDVDVCFLQRAMVIKPWTNENKKIFLNIILCLALLQWMRI